MHYIYLDYAATTPLDPDAALAAKPYYNNLFFNPSSLHALGQKAAGAVKNAREKCAFAINADSSEIYFTSGGTESINWAMRSVAGEKRHIVVSAIEHDAVIACAEYLEKNGCEVDYIKPNKRGTITVDALNSVLRDDTALVCVMAVNNIVGSIQPIKELAAAAHGKNALFFTDAVQAMNGLNVDVKDWDVDMLAVSGHKFYAPKGTGFLYVKRGTVIESMMFGGEQERGLRAGTVDVPSVVAMGVAAEKAQRLRENYVAHAKTVTEAFTKALDYGDIIECENKTDDIVCVRFYSEHKNIDGGRIAVALSCAGVCCSVGSACSAGSATSPKTLLEMDVEHANTAVRFSFGRKVSVAAAVNAAKIVNETIAKLLQ